MRAVIEALQALARHREGLGRHDRGRSRRALAVHARAAADGLQRLGRSAKTRAATATAAAGSPRPATRICGGSSSRPPGPIGIGPALGRTLRKRQARLSQEVKEIAWKAQHRLHARYRRLLGRGKCPQRWSPRWAASYSGFIWAIGRAVETTPTPRPPVTALDADWGKRTAGAAAVEGHTERRILDAPMRQAFGRTRVASPRQLPTDHDYAVSTREYQSDQPSRQPPRPPPLLPDLEA